MLPSFRLIAATFLCGFFVVFAGLRLAASLNDLHEGLPVMAAHAAPVAITPAADREARRGLAPVPVMYDLRFAISTVAPTLVRVPPMVLDRPAPPLSIVPPEDIDKESSLYAAPETEAAKETTKETAVPEATVAAIHPATPESAVIPDAPAEAPTPKAPAVAAIDSQAKPDTAADWPPAETPAPATKAAATEPQAAPSPSTEEPLTGSEPDAAAETPAAPETGPEQMPGSPAAAMPAPKPQALKSSPHARIKVARKKPIRIAHRAAPMNTFGSSAGAFGSLPGTAR